ncbi:hypothetical protein L9F63_025320, partial [Diploptera punctata]
YEYMAHAGINTCHLFLLALLTLDVSQAVPPHLVPADSMNLNFNFLNWILLFITGKLSVFQWMTFRSHLISCMSPDTM